MKHTIFVALLLLLVSPGLRADVPSFVTYSGRLTDGTVWGESSQVDLTFVLHPCGCTAGEGCPVPCTGAPEEWNYVTTHKSVQVVDGYFTVNLGMCDETGDDCTVNPAEATFPSNLPGQIWVEVMFGGVGMEPWQPVGSVPFAVTAGHAASAGDCFHSEIESAGILYSLSAIYLGTTKNAAAVTNQEGSFISSGATAGRIEFQGAVGYRAAKLACEAALDSPSAHMCMSHEMVRSQQMGLIDGAPDSIWIASGIVESVIYPADQMQVTKDCAGWTVSDEMTGTYINKGSVWMEEGYALSAKCNGGHYVACCDHPI